MKVRPLLEHQADEYRHKGNKRMEFILGEILRLLSPQTTLNPEQQQKVFLLLEAEAQSNKPRDSRIVIAEITNLVNALYSTSLLERITSPRTKLVRKKSSIPVSDGY